MGSQLSQLHATPGVTSSSMIGCSTGVDAAEWVRHGPSAAALACGSSSPKVPDPRCATHSTSPLGMTSILVLLRGRKEMNGMLWQQERDRSSGPGGSLGMA